MIQRMVLLKFKDEFANSDFRGEAASRSRRVLRNLPGVLDVSVGIPADKATEGSWDLSMVLNFESVDAISTYIVHPDHRDYVDNFLKPHLEIIKAWNFDSTSDPDFD